VIDALCDPEVPNLPPHISLKQAKNFMSAILEGDTGRRPMIRGAFKDALQGVLPHRR
jgi:pyruvate dehydrogenase (quinone)